MISDPGRSRRIVPRVRQAAVQRESPDPVPVKCNTYENSFSERFLFIGTEGSPVSLKEAQRILKVRHSQKSTPKTDHRRHGMAAFRHFPPSKLPLSKRSVTFCCSGYRRLVQVDICPLQPRTVFPAELLQAQVSCTRKGKAMWWVFSC